MSQSSPESPFLLFCHLLSPFVLDDNFTIHSVPDKMRPFNLSSLFWHRLMLYVPVNSYGHVGTVSYLINHTFSLGKLDFACKWQQLFLNQAVEGRRMEVEIISWSISTKVWDQAGIEIVTPWSAARHITDCPTRPSLFNFSAWAYLQSV